MIVFVVRGKPKYLIGAEVENPAERAAASRRCLSNPEAKTVDFEIFKHKPEIQGKFSKNSRVPFIEEGEPV